MNTNDPRYKYEKVNVLKAIVVSRNRRVLLIQEPETNEWMPGHWGLPGGKALVKESLIEAFVRKMKDDLGIDNAKPIGFYQVQELLMEGKTAMMYHLVAEVDEEFAPKGEIAGFKWVSESDVNGMKMEDFTEFFNRNLLLTFFGDEGELVPLSFIKTQDYFNKEISDQDYQDWKKSGDRK